MARVRAVILLCIACTVLALGAVLAQLTISFPRAWALLSGQTIAVPQSESPAVHSLPPITREDINAVYKKVIGELFVYEGVRMVVIQASSTGCPMYEDEQVRHELPYSEPFLTFVKSRILEAEVETLNDYLQKNQNPTRLENLFDLGIKSVIVNEDDLRDAFPKHGVDRGWTRFYRKYPKSSGIMFFSNIGFNSSNDQAFLYAGRQCGGLCGSGKYVFLRKENGEWIIDHKLELWVS